MKPIDVPDGDPAAGKKPPPYEHKCLLEGLCGISRECKVDWEMHVTYGLRPVGFIRAGECHWDQEAWAEALRNMCDNMARRSSSTGDRSTAQSGAQLDRGSHPGVARHDGGNDQSPPQAQAPIGNTSAESSAVPAKPKEETQVRRSLPEAKALLARLYGFEFPDSLFLLHEFLTGLGEKELEAYLDALRMYPIGPLALLSLADSELEKLKPTLSLVLHWRFFRDVPEFFTCLRGDQDWLHWGLLLDEPAKGFRGAASYYHHGLEQISVYPSLFAAVLKRIEECISCCEGVEDNKKADPEDIANAHTHLDYLRRFSEKFHRFIQDRHIALDDGRGKGIPSDTGLSLLTSDTGKDWFSNILDWYSHWPRSDWSVFPPTGYRRVIHLFKIKDPREIDRLVQNAVAACKKGRALPALSLGRSLWYWGSLAWLGMENSSEQYSAVAYDLLKRAYTLLDRPALLPVLDMHFAHRDIESVDLLKS
jgi:hypothetical protein